MNLWLVQRQDMNILWLIKQPYPYTTILWSLQNSTMIQAARSTMSNIVEGSKHVSLKGYIYLVGIARGSLEELLKDYQAFARQKDIPVYPPVKAKSEIRLT